MTNYDLAVLALYFVFMLSISWVFRHFVSDVGSYFRSGGQVMWWMAGGSAFMVSFSAWTFTGASSRAYLDGWPIMVIFIANAFGFFCNAVYFGPKMRQLRVITSMEAVKQRFGRGSEQTFTWIIMPLQLMTGGIWLYGMGVFFSAAFGFDVKTTIIITGLCVLLMSLLGGSWAVIASDFVQVLILIPITIITAILAVVHIGGLPTVMEKLSTTRLDMGKLFTDDYLLFWCVAIFLKQFLSTNNLNDASRYLCVKDSSHARKAGILAGCLFLGGVFFWFLPPMIQSMSSTDLATVFPNLGKPAEGAYFAIAQTVFPVGMMGLLAAGIFAATMSSMDSSLNRNAGIFVKNFYQPILRPQATDRELLNVGKSVTIALGFLVILIAIFYSQIKGLSLFELMLKFQILVSLPYVVPLVLGLLIRRTPGWAGWSTLVVCFFVSFMTNAFLNIDWAVGIFGSTDGITTWERQNWEQGIGVFTITGAGIAWFLFTRRFYERQDPEVKAGIEVFSKNLDKPVNYAEEESMPSSDNKQARMMGWLCIPYGGVVLLMTLIPNPMLGRLSFIFCGLTVIGIGTLLVRQSKGEEPS
ncbi:MAG: transporter [Opitutaceae bacterium]|jgi:solute:Na+ symporter, SSS family|nr:transporter [Opitutaceae bacterium]